MHFSNGRFSNRETVFSGPYVVWSLLGAPGEKKRENQMFLQSPLSGEKKCKRFSSPEKKIHLAESCGWGALAANVGPLGRPGGYQRPTLGQPSVNVGSTLGIFPSHLGPIFADFAGFVD